MSSLMRKMDTSMSLTFSLDWRAKTAEGDGEVLSYSDLVREALDYRKWFEFKMFYYRLPFTADQYLIFKAGKGNGYEWWAKVFNLKEAVKTLNFLVENGVADYGELAARANAAGEKFDARYNNRSC